MSKRNILIIVVILVAVISLMVIISSLLNQKFAVLLDISPTGTYQVKVSGSEYTLTGVSELQLTSGSHTIEISGKDYHPYKTEIKVERNNDNYIKIDVSANKITPELNQIKGLNSNTLSNYKVVFQKTYQNGSWIIMILQNSSQASEKLLFVANKQNDSWVLIIPPSAIINEQQIQELPEEAKNDVRVFSESNYGEPHERAE